MLLVLTRKSRGGEDENSGRIKMKPTPFPPLYYSNIARNIAREGLKLNRSLLRRVNTYNTYVYNNILYSIRVRAFL